MPAISDSEYDNLTPDEKKVRDAETRERQRLRSAEELAQQTELAQLEYYLKRLETARYKLVESNPRLKDPAVLDLLPERLDRGAPIPGVHYEKLLPGALHRFRDLESRIAAYEDAIEIKQKSASANKPPRIQPATAPDIMRRREFIKRYCTDNGLTRATLANRATTCVTAIQGMVRNDRTRYSEETLARLLKTIGVSPEKW